jgi:membrane protein implicated in regulation of membrane protease activity
MNFLENATVTTLYFVLIALGMIYALFLLITGQFGSDGDFGGDGGDFDFDLDADVDVGIDGGDTSGGISPVSPLTIATFITAFGATGLVAMGLFEVTERSSILWATGGGVLFSVLTYLGFTYLLIKPQGSSEVRIAEVVGSHAEVLTPIPEDGLGEIAFVAQGGRVTYSARSVNKEKIARGMTVRITRVVGGVAYVEPFVEE